MCSNCESPDKIGCAILDCQLVLFCRDVNLQLTCSWWHLSFGLSVSVLIEVLSLRACKISYYFMVWDMAVILGRAMDY